MAIRYLFALDFLAPHLPPERDSGRDIALLRAANLAMRRDRAGIEDAFLFVVYGACDSEAAQRALADYGFPRLTVRLAGEDEALESDEQGRVSINQDFEVDIGREVQRWVEREHPGSLPLLSLLAPDREALEDYGTLEWRWLGLEAGDSDFPWPFDNDAFSKLLPWTHTRRAETWLALLQAGSDFNENDIGRTPYESFQIGARVAALCEWLNGFEAASGNSYNHFEPAHAAEALGLNDVFLGFEAATERAQSARMALNEAESDEAIRATAVLAVTEKRRAGVLSALAVLGSDSALFFTLYSSIWPRYEVPTTEAATALLDLEYLEYGEIEAAWQFVTDGWHESAYAGH